MHSKFTTALPGAKIHNFVQILWPQLSRSCGEAVEKLLRSCREVVEKLWTSCREVVEKLWRSCREDVYMLWRSRRRTLAPTFKISAQRQKNIFVISHLWHLKFDPDACVNIQNFSQKSAKVFVISQKSGIQRSPTDFTITPREIHQSSILSAHVLNESSTFRTTETFWFRPNFSASPENSWYRTRGT